VCLLLRNRRPGLLQCARIAREIVIFRIAPVLTKTTKIPSVFKVMREKCRWFISLVNGQGGKILNFDQIKTCLWFFRVVLLLFLNLFFSGKRNCEYGKTCFWSVSHLLGTSRRLTEHQCCSPALTPTLAWAQLLWQSSTVRSSFPPCSYQPTVRKHQ